jgi:hypothetical protein
MIGMLFLTSYLFIFLKAFQQRNVAFDHYIWIMPVSYAMAATEVFIIAEVAKEGWGILLILAVGTGSGLGALSAALIHKRYVK